MHLEDSTITWRERRRSFVEFKVLLVVTIMIFKAASPSQWDGREWYECPALGPRWNLPVLLFCTVGLPALVNCIVQIPTSNCRSRHRSIRTTLTARNDSCAHGARSLSLLMTGMLGHQVLEGKSRICRNHGKCLRAV